MSAYPQRPLGDALDALSTSASMRDWAPDPSSLAPTTQPTAHRGRPCTDAQGRTWRDSDEWWERLTERQHQREAQRHEREPENTSSDDREARP
jgi:hypothetical protein